jgi:predicted phosphohydrolase
MTEKAGAQWVIYAGILKEYRPKEDVLLQAPIPASGTILATGHCSRTSRLENAAEDIRYFDSLPK